MRLKLFGFEIEFRKETDEEARKREERDRETRERNAEAYRKFFGWRL
jgi:hypothetical protein